MVYHVVKCAMAEFAVRTLYVNPILHVFFAAEGLIRQRVIVPLQVHVSWPSALHYRA